MSEKIVNKYGFEIFKTKYGYYPCDRETFLKLKALFKEYMRSLSQMSKWVRWNRKMPHNRLIRKKIRDSSGRVIGHEVIGLQPEPILSSIFCEKKTEVGEKYCKKEGKWAWHPYTYEVVVPKNIKPFLDDYWRASSISLEPDYVCKLKLSLEELDKLYNMI